MLKHVGRIKRNQKKCVIACRVIPGAPDYALIVPTEALPADEHDSLMKLVESTAGQQSHELMEVMTRTRLPDGRIMAASFHATGKFLKMEASNIELTPNTQTVVSLDVVNAEIAKKNGTTVADLAMKDANAEQSTPVVQETEIQDPAAAYIDDPLDPAPAAVQAAASETEVLSDEQLAASYRSQADALFKEAKALREQAKEISERLKADSE